MMKKLVEKLIQLRNPQFQFDEHVELRTVCALAFEKGLEHLRSYKLLLHGKIPHKLFLGKGVRFFNSSKIDLGRWVKLGDHVYLSGLGKGILRIGDHSGIGAFSRVIVSTSFNNIGEFIHIGNNVGIGEFAYLGGGGGLTIGDDCIVGQYFSCHPENHYYINTKKLIRDQGVSRQGISIGKNCWIGSKVTVLDGVKIGDNCVIAAGAVVTKNMPADSVIGGVPAKILKKRNEMTESKIIPMSMI